MGNQLCEFSEDDLTIKQAASALLSQLQHEVGYLTLHDLLLYRHHVEGWYTQPALNVVDHLIKHLGFYQHDIPAN